MIRLIVTFFYVGHLRPMSGTWGSLAALPVGYAIALLGGWPLLTLSAIAAFGIGVWATARYIDGNDDHDPSEVVIDEVAGQWIALIPVVIGASRAGADMLALWPGWVTAFVAFRFFDILKPGPIGWADRRGDALGVMLDDVIAGIFPAICVMIGAGISHGLIGV